jgi:nitric oxide reductase subunit B
MIVSGKGSGREYTPWPGLLTPLLLLSVGVCGVQWLRIIPLGYALSPEGTVLLAIGWSLTFLGFLESQAQVLPWVFLNGVRDLTSQWHGIDTFVAGINVLLYAGMVVLLQPYPKPLRKKFLFGIAAFGLLGTFGHHHYASPQPLFLKYFAFFASMVAVISFVRHMQGFRKQKRTLPGPNRDLFQLLLSAEAWTLVAVGSGVLFAIPQINFYIHGTYLIISHAMGSMIGINLLIIIAAGLHFCGYDKPNASSSLRWGLPILNFSLMLLWIGLTIPSLLKAMERTHSTFQFYQPLVEPWLMFFPLAGVGLFAGIFALCSELLWAAASDRGAR